MFPLYDNLLRLTEYENNDLSIEQKKKIAEESEALDPLNQEIIYVLIKLFFIDNDVDEKSPLPYEGKRVKGLLKFDIDKLPLRLRHMLYRFILMKNNNLNQTPRNINEYGNNYPFIQ